MKFWLYARARGAAQHPPARPQRQGRRAIAIGVFFSYPQLFKGRRVVHFVDNTVALSAMINGYSGKPDLAHMVNMFHAALIALDMRWYGEWVPSKANITTRPERFHELLDGLRRELAGKGLA